MSRRFSARAASATFVLIDDLAEIQRVVKVRF